MESGAENYFRRKRFKLCKQKQRRMHREVKCSRGGERKGEQHGYTYKKNRREISASCVKGMYSLTLKLCLLPPETTKIEYLLLSTNQPHIFVNLRRVYAVMYE